MLRPSVLLGDLGSDKKVFIVLSHVGKYIHFLHIEKKNHSLKCVLK